ncbi:hypothetical protein H072_7738 [Dactylellina haptotyla CBS 200.50]|uniref:CHAT domain-containing protein n=1 Tax=Dactylellina haptotyla (strain CBS 200.50) TaxID=1284197 RepID=S8A6M8_DACHA|nr:hypothetical protein H072_7738 [Dactylellina haptotyla CBS 200.50]
MCKICVERNTSERVLLVLLELRLKSSGAASGLREVLATHRIDMSLSFFPPHEILTMERSILTPPALHLRLTATKRCEDVRSWDYKLQLQEKCVRGILKNPFADHPQSEEDLRWVLEDFLIKDPFSKAKAGIICSAVEDYGRNLYGQLEEDIRKLLPQDVEFDTRKLYRLEISGVAEDQSVQLLHWETLELVNEIRINVVRLVARNALQISRYKKVEQTSSSKCDDHASPINAEPRQESCAGNPPTKRNHTEERNNGYIHILICTARAVRPDDIEISNRQISNLVYQSVASSLHHRGVKLDFVRPGTWEALKEALVSKPFGYYSIIHLDVHGIVSRNRPYIYLTRSEDPRNMSKRGAADLGDLLAGSGVPIAVFNACDSARPSSTGESNLAAVLIQRGLTCVIGMSFKLLVSSASKFIPILYREILQNQGDITLAVNCARHALHTDRKRTGVLGTSFEIPDAIVPVVYCAENAILPTWDVSETTIQALSSGKDYPTQSLMSIDSLQLESPVIGRELDLLRLETSLCLESNCLEFIGPIGSGKTTFLKYAADWWEQTGFVDQVLWIDCPAQWRRFLVLLKERPWEKRGPQSRPLIIVDGIDELLSSLAKTEKTKLSNLVIEQTNSYFIFSTDFKASNNMKGFPVFQFGNLSSTSAAQLALRCVWILDYNPGAIELVFTSIGPKASPRELFDALLRTPSQTKILKFIDKSNITKRVEILFNTLESYVEQIIFISLYNCRLLLRKDVHSYIKSLLLTQILSITRNPEFVRAKSRKSSNVSLSSVFRWLQWFRELKAISGTVAVSFLDSFWNEYLELEPYFQQYNSVIRKLEAEGLTTDYNSTNWKVHPLLPFAIRKAFWKGREKLFTECEESYYTLHRLYCSSWDVTKLWDITSPKMAIPRSRIEVLTEISIDVANCVRVCSLIVEKKGKSWNESFAWRLLILMAAKYCTLYDADIPGPEKSMVVDLLKRFLHQWNKIGHLKHSFFAGRYRNEVATDDCILDKACAINLYSDGPHFGFICAIVCAVSLAKNSSLGTAKETYLYSLEGQRLYILAKDIYAFILGSDSMLDLTYFMMHFRGFVSVYSPEDLALWRIQLPEVPATVKSLLDEVYQDGAKERAWLEMQCLPLQLRDYYSTLNLGGKGDATTTSLEPINPVLYHRDNTQLIQLLQHEILTGNLEGELRETLCAAFTKLSQGEKADGRDIIRSLRVKLPKNTRGLLRGETLSQGERERCGIILNFEGFIEVSLENFEAAKALFIDSRGYMSIKCDSLSLRKQLLLTYSGLLVCEVFKPDPEADFMGVEKLEWLIEYGCLLFNTPRRGVPALQTVFDAYVETSGVSQLQLAEFHEFQSVYVFAMIICGIPSISKPNLTLAMRTNKWRVFRIFKNMLGIEKGDLTYFLLTTNLLYLDLRESSESEEAFYQSLFSEGARILFGTVGDCQGLKYLTEFENKPLRRRWPWLGFRDGLIDTYGTEKHKHQNMLRKVYEAKS